MAKRFKRRSNIVQAMQWTGANFGELTQWANEKEKIISKGHANYLIIDTMDGRRLLHPTTWVIKTIENKFCICRNETFLKLYYPIENDECLDVIDQIRLNRKKINRLHQEIYK